MLIRTVVVAATFCVLAATSVAQIHTATLSIQVRANDGTRLPGVSVEVVNSETGLRRILQTDQSGMASVPGLPPGTYKVAATLDGFGDGVLEGVVLRVGQTSDEILDIQPRLAEEITVSDKVQLVDTRRQDVSTNVIPEQIEMLPVADRKFERLALIVPGTQRDRVQYLDRTGSPVIGSGSNAALTTYVVDGADFTDPWAGLARQRINQDAIREFRVSSQGFGVEAGLSVGGVISVVTKSGTNQFHGSGSAFYRSDALRSRGALELEDIDYSRLQGAFTLGGPIAVDRSHFFVAGESLEENDIALVRPGGAFVDLAADVQTPIRQADAILTFNHSFSPSSVADARLYWERYRRENYDVGGVTDESHGWSWNRDAWNLVLGWTLVLEGNRLNELRVLAGVREAEFPNNTDIVGEWFSLGNTLQTGGTFLVDSAVAGDFYEIRDTYNWQAAEGRHVLKSGLGYLRVENDYQENAFRNGLMAYLDDTRFAPFLYYTGFGNGVGGVRSNQFSAFIHDNWRARDSLSLGFGLRYDIDVGGNNPDVEHPLVPGGRDVDADNLQPRLSFSWDVGSRGRDLLRGGVGRFVGRYNLFATNAELLSTGESSWTAFRRFNGALLGLPRESWLDPRDPENTGIPLAPEVKLLSREHPNPESIQGNLGYTRPLGGTGLFLDVEGVYAVGDNELLLRNTNWGGNDNPGPINPAYSYIDTYTTEGHSRYRGLTVGLNGSIKGGHLLTGSITAADRMNLWDDVVTLQDLNDSADPEGEYGRSGTSEALRLVITGIFRLPWHLTVAPIYEYGTGQPWNRILGYDYNGDGRTGDRAEGVDRNDQDGPPFRELSVRVAKAIPLGKGELEAIVEAFNLLDTVNFDVNSVDQAMYFDGPTLANPDLPYIPNPRFGQYTATLRPRVIQLGLRWRF